MKQEHVVTNRMRFEQYGPSGIRGARIDWRPVEITQDIRDALHPQPPESMRSGVLKAQWGS